jgi:O-antigen/teichoic acid export membrane protein
MAATKTKNLTPSSGLVNSIANISGLLIPLVIFFLVTPILISNLGTSHFGVLTLFLAGVALVASFDFGLNSGGTRALGEAIYQDGNKSFIALAYEWWSAYLVLGFIMAISILALGLFFFEIFGIDDSFIFNIRWHILFYFSITTFCGFCASSCQLVWRAKEMFLGSMVLQVTYGSILWLGCGSLAWFGFGIDHVLSWIAALSILFVFINKFSLMYLLKEYRWLPRLYFKNIVKLRSYNLYAFSAQVASNMTYHADKFIISALLGPVLVGYYGIASNLSSKILMLVATGSGFIFPRVVRLSAQSETKSLSDTYLQASRYVMLLSWPLVIVAIIFGGQFLRLWLGDEISIEVVGPLRLLLVAYFINSLSVIASQVFNGIGNAKVGAFFATTGAVVNLLGCLVLIPFLGLIGVALASVLASLQVFIFMILLHRHLKLNDWPFIHFWGRIALVSVAPIIVAFGLFGLINGWLSFLIIATGVWSLFYILWFGLGFADDAEAAIIRRLYSGIKYPFGKR